MSWLAGRLHRYCLGRPCRVISPAGRPYLVRVYLWHWGGWRVYLHRFVAGDGERWLHDHPFTAAALVLTGGYDEEVLPALGLPPRIVRRRGLNWITRRKYHRIARVHSTTWTLFVHGPHNGAEWGFLEPADTHNGSVAWLYHNPLDQSDSGGAHWWDRPGVEIYPPEAEA